jgi:hypothetical protein
MDEYVAARLPALSLAFFNLREKASSFIRDALKQDVMRGSAEVPNASNRWNLSRLFTSTRPPRSNCER